MNSPKDEYRMNVGWEHWEATKAQLITYGGPWLLESNCYNVATRMDGDLKEIIAIGSGSATKAYGRAATLCGAVAVMARTSSNEDMGFPGFGKLVAAARELINTPEPPPQAPLPAIDRPTDVTGTESQTSKPVYLNVMEEAEIHSANPAAQLAKKEALTKIDPYSDNGKTVKTQEYINPRDINQCASGGHHDEKRKAAVIPTTTLSTSEEKREATAAAATLDQTEEAARRPNNRRDNEVPKDDHKMNADEDIKREVGRQRRKERRAADHSIVGYSKVWCGLRPGHNVQREAIWGEALTRVTAMCGSDVWYDAY